MNRHLDAIRINNPRFALMYSALQFGPDEMAKPDGSLSLPYVAGALRRASYDVDIMDVSVGKAEDRLEETFLRPTQLPSGLNRCGVPLSRVAAYIFQNPVEEGLATSADAYAFSGGEYFRLAEAKASALRPDADQ